MMFSVAIRLNVLGLTIVAVPSQLLPTTRMSWVVVRLGFVAAFAAAGRRASEAMAAAVRSLGIFTARIVFRGHTPVRGFRSAPRFPGRAAHAHARRRRLALRCAARRGGRD